MKKAILIFSLVLAISSALLAGTLASYTLTLNVASGSFVSKEFIFTEEGTEGFEQDVKIAPTDSFEWKFSVKNFDGTLVTETDMYYELVFTAEATEGKDAIAPLRFTVKNNDGEVVGSINGTGTVKVYDAFPLSETGQKHEYKLQIQWPSNKDVDINYAGQNFGTNINVTATASQLPFDENNGGGEDSQEPGQGFATVIYKTTTPWSGKYQFMVTIINTSDTTINNWNISMLFPDEIDKLWNAEIIPSSSDPSSGLYVFRYPLSYDEEGKSIAPGKSVSFTGHAFGNGTEPITSVMVNGINATVEYGFGTLE